MIVCGAEPASSFLVHSDWTPGEGGRAGARKRGWDFRSLFLFLFFVSEVVLCAPPFAPPALHESSPSSCFSLSPLRRDGRGARSGVVEFAPNAAQRPQFGQGCDCSFSLSLAPFVLFFFFFLLLTFFFSLAAPFKKLKQPAAPSLPAPLRAARPSLSRKCPASCL